MKALHLGSNLWFCHGFAPLGSDAMIFITQTPILVIKAIRALMLHCMPALDEVEGLQKGGVTERLGGVSSSCGFWTSDFRV